MATIILYELTARFVHITWPAAELSYSCRSSWINVKAKVYDFRQVFYVDKFISD